MKKRSLLLIEEKFVINESETNRGETVSCQVLLTYPATVKLSANKPIMILEADWGALPIELIRELVT